MGTPGGLGAVSKPVDESWDMWVNQARGAPANQQLSLDTQQLGTQQLGVVHKGALGLHTAQLAGKERTVNILSLGQIQSSLISRFGDRPGKLIYDQLFAAKKTDHQPIYAAEIRLADAIGRTLEKGYQLLANGPNPEIDEAQAKIVAICDKLTPVAALRLQQITQATDAVKQCIDKDDISLKQGETYAQSVTEALRRIEQVSLESKPSAHGDAAQAMQEGVSSPKASSGWHAAIFIDPEGILRGSPKASRGEHAAPYAGKYTKTERSSQIASLGQAISEDNVGGVEKALNWLKSMPPSNSPLTKKEEGSLIDGLYLALQNGHTDTVKAFLGALPQLKVQGLLTKDQVFKIVEARWSDGRLIGLYMALQNGCADTAKAFLGALSELGSKGLLTSDQIYSILRAKLDNWTPGLYMALQEGCTDTVKAFLGGLSELGSQGLLTEHQIFRISQAGNGDDPPGLHTALKRGHTETITTYLRALSDLGLTREHLQEIVEAEGHGGAGLVEAMKRGRHGTVDKFVAEIGNLDLDQEWVQDFVLNARKIVNPSLTITTARRSGIN